MLPISVILPAAAVVGVLLILFLIWAALAIHPLHRADWALENALVVVAAILIWGAAAALFAAPADSSGTLGLFKWRESFQVCFNYFSGKGNKSNKIKIRHIFIKKILFIC